MLLILLMLLAQSEDTVHLNVYEDPDGNYKTMGYNNYEWDAEVGDILVFDPAIIFNHYEA